MGRSSTSSGGASEAGEKNEENKEKEEKDKENDKNKGGDGGGGDGNDGNDKEVEVPEKIEDILVVDVESDNPLDDPEVNKLLELDEDLEKAFEDSSGLRVAIKSIGGVVGGLMFLFLVYKVWELVK
jgi:hypothetical protein